MTEQELRKAIEQKGYTYNEEPESDESIAVVAKRGSEIKFVGYKSLLLSSTLDKFKQNDAYKKL